MIKRFRRLPGFAKGLFLRLRLHVFVPVKAFNFLGHMAMLARWIKKNPPVGSSDFYTRKFDYSKREVMYEKVIEMQSLDNQPIDYLEFGVSKGESFRWWIGRLQHEEVRFHGFDTFTGLPEDWGGFKKGDMGNDDEFPQIDDTRHTFYKGLFQETLLPFLATYKADKRKVIHMDADIYSATLYVLTLITPYLNKGDIIIFDEFNVPMHEFKAFDEWSKSFYIEYKLLEAVNNYYQVAILIE